ncbi:hypothetical protein LTR17_009135 [Elasticomyces elasticus]|nr:hypothetical protein LTR17_009135 [Elasticomyces elasticus]
MGLPPPAYARLTLRLASVIAATVIALSCGTNYAFSAWSPQFASRLHLSATQQNLIGNFGNIGMYAMGIPGGILIDTRGPRWGVAAGVLSLALGYFPLRAAYVAGPGVYSMPVLCLMGLMTGMGSCTAFSAAIKVSASNFPRHRGTATAFPLSAFGLSAFFYTSVSALAFPDDTAGYLGLLAWGTTSMVFVGLFGLQLVRTEVGQGYTAVDGGERPGLGGRRESSKMRRSTEHIRATSKGSNAEAGTADETSSLVGSDTTSSPGDVDDVQDAKLHPSHHHHHGPEITGVQLLRTPKFWQLFIMLGLLCGVGLMTINNIGNNALALWHHYDDSAGHDFIQKRQLLHVSILSLCSFAGRLLSGIGSDWLVHHHASRFWTLVASAGLFCSAQVVALTLQNPNNLFWLSGLTGLAYGALFGVYPALVADAFGPTGLGINWGAMTMAPVLSGNIFNLFYGRILDGHSHWKAGDGGGHGEGGGETVCEEGRECYSGAYWLTLVASVIGVGWALWCIRHEKVGRMRESKAAMMREHEG